MEENPHPHAPAPQSGNPAVMAIGMAIVAIIIFGAGFMAGRGTAPAVETAQAETQAATQEPASGTPDDGLGALAKYTEGSDEAAFKAKAEAEAKGETPEGSASPSPFPAFGAPDMTAGKGKEDGTGQPPQTPEEQQAALAEQQMKQMKQQQQIDAAQEAELQRQRDAVPSLLTERPPRPAKLGNY